MVYRSGSAEVFETQLAQFARPEMRSVRADFEFGAGVGGALAAAALRSAMTANRVLARQIGWGCVSAGQVSPIPELRTLLGLAPGATEADVARAIAGWQRSIGQPGNGQLGARTWAEMLRPGRPGQPVISRPNFQTISWPVVFGGHKLGILEKTAPYELCFLDAGSNVCRGTRTGVADERGAARIQLGFRVTDIDAVRRAHFVDSTGAPHFNFVQMIETNRPLQQGPPGPGGAPIVQVVRRYRRYIDPTAIPRDNHPYYWDEPGDISQNINRQARDAFFPNASQLCYDVLFWDQPSRRLADAQPGQGIYWNAEVSLVGIRIGKKNVVLNSVEWGFDIRPQPTGLTVHLNALRAGPVGGSTALRRVVNQEIRSGNFPGHCFIGSGYTGTARCT